MRHRWPLLLFLTPFLLLTFSPIPGERWSTLIGRLGPGPDLNTHTQGLRYGLVLPWLYVTHTWNESSGVNTWRVDAFHPEKLAMHLALPCLAAALVFALGRRKRAESPAPDGAPPAAG